ncbi:MAG: glycosyltransferase [Candidatus Omnitrophota bacterium]
MKVDILVLNYNGRDLMKEYLPSICTAAERSAHECKVHVVDNQSKDGSIEMLRNDFDKVKLHQAPENKVLCSYNDVVKELDSEVVILLNNDIKVEPDFADYLVERFDDRDVMFTAPMLKNFDGSYNGGKSLIRAEYGVIKIFVDEKNSSRAGRTMAIATGAFRRSLFVDLGGFDDLYLPGIWEDVDLCFRGLKRGLKGEYEPRSVIWHDESTTFNREYGAKKKLCLAHRNMFLFFWKNIHDPVLIAGHILFLPLRLVYSVLRGKPELVQGFFMAIRKLPEALKKRRDGGKDKMFEKLEDRDIIL